MDQLKPMPEREKYKHAIEMVDLYQKHVLPFVEDRLGYPVMHNLRSVWQAGISLIHEDESDGEKYEHAYSSWLWVARSSHNILAEHLSAEEILDYKRLLLRLYEQQLDLAALTIPRLLKNHAAFAKALLYQMQWQTPIEAIKIEKNLVTGEIRRCRILQVPGSERVCRVDCQHIGKSYASRVYHLKRTSVPSAVGCTITLTPLEGKSN